MQNHNCIFCKIITGQIPSKPLYETKYSIVIQDIAPQAPIHYLIIPKIHVQDLISCSDQKILIDLISIPASLATMLGKNNNTGPVDFKLITNNGYAAGQRVFHLHFHFLSGKTFLEN